MALIGEMPGGTLAGKTRERDCDFGISVNEAMVEIGKAEERLNILDFHGTGQSWMIWTLYGVTAYI